MDNKFFKSIQSIQKDIINVMLIKSDKYNNVQEMLEDTTYETIYALLAMLDGFGPDKIKYEIKNTQNNTIENESTTLHDKCEEFLLFSEK